jgi:hypothetical protein
MISPKHIELYIQNKRYFKLYEKQRQIQVNSALQNFIFFRLYFVKFSLLSLLAAVCFIALMQQVAGQPVAITSTADSAAYIYSDSALPKLRTISDSSLEYFRNNPGFDYSRDAQKGLSWSDLLQRWLLELFDDIFSSKGVRGAWETGKYILMAVAVAAIIFLFSKTGVRSLFIRSSGVISAPGITTENIHEIDFSAFIAEAVAAGNFARAVRLLYLQTLKQLADAELVVWKPEKTNRDYEREIRKTAPQSSEKFIFLTDIFERICYGKQSVTSQEYKQISAVFENYFTILRLGKDIDVRHKIFGKKEPAE